MSSTLLITSSLEVFSFDGNTMVRIGHPNHIGNPAETFFHWFLKSMVNWFFEGNKQQSNEFVRAVAEKLALNTFVEGQCLIMTSYTDNRTPLDEATAERIRINIAQAREPRNIFAFPSYPYDMNLINQALQLLKLKADPSWDFIVDVVTDALENFHTANNKERLHNFFINIGTYRDILDQVEHLIELNKIRRMVLTQAKKWQQASIEVNAQGIASARAKIDEIMRDMA